MNMPTPEEARKKVFELIQDVQVTLMVTHEAQSGLHARPMVAHKLEGKPEAWDGRLWFFTSASSPKVAEIERNSDVLLAYSNPSKQHYVSLSGKAEVVRDRAKIKELWSEFLRTWFPKGEDDPDIALIHVHAEGAEYWDTPSSVAVYAYGYIKARLTGERPDVGENAKVALG